jgi:hypothetical protein
MWIDDEDGLTKCTISLSLTVATANVEQSYLVTLTSCRQFPLTAGLLPVHVLLVGLDLYYSWQRFVPAFADTQPQCANHPFSSRLSLPFRTVLDNVIGRFVTWQLVK